MPKSKLANFKEVKKPSKVKLSPVERSQIAKDRWAKRRATVADTNATNAKAIVVDWPTKQEAEANTTPPAQPPTQNPPPSPNLPPYPQNPTPEQPPVSPESQAPSPLLMSGEPINQEPFRPVPQAAPYEPPAPLPAPVKPPKQKRYTGPKEFSVALKAAENRLAKAVQERAEYAGKLAAVNAEIPSLLQIIQALKGSGNFAPPAAYDFSGNGTGQQFQPPMPNFQSMGTPYQAPVDLGAIQAAMAQPPVSRASGGAIQFGPDVVGSLEGPDDDDPDKYITGPAAGGSGWIGG